MENEFFDGRKKNIYSTHQAIVKQKKCVLLAVVASQMAVVTRLCHYAVYRSVDANDDKGNGQS